MTEWKPISTAPKDGTEIMLRRVDCPGYDCVGRYASDGWLLPWFFIRGDMTMHKSPTEWMPLPPPPQETDA